MSPTAIMVSQSCFKWPTLLLPGTFAAVNTPTTPGKAFASSVWTASTLARGYSLRTALPKIMPSIWTSSG